MQLRDFKIKRLDLFMLQSFVPLFVMTFFICLFIVLMQFLWRYIDDLVGKGLGIDVIAELFFYAALTMIPMALPLAILLASLMTFGNLGERFELTAMKSAGISLLRSMSSLIVLMVIIAIGAFFFQNNVLPIAQTKMYTLLFSMRQKSPEVEIPEGVFYDQIPGYNLFVQKKNPETGILYDLMIYNMSKGFENSSIILADSGRLAFTDDKTHLYLHLWNGESFENLREATTASSNVPYRRESFTEKEILVQFDANFNRMDEAGMRNQYVGKNINELQATIDSVKIIVDSLGHTYGNDIRLYPYFGIQRKTRPQAEDDTASIFDRDRDYFPEVTMTKPLNVDSLFAGATSSYRINYLKSALNKAKRQHQEIEFKSFPMRDQVKTINSHGIEMQKKFTLSFACIIFFFIGAPLGAIIRKGGLGMPLVISVFLFIFYYIIDNTGYKFARDGRLAVWEGIWLSSAVLLPLGIFLTYKAVNDSAVFNADAYANFFRKLIGRHEVRKVEFKEVIINEVDRDTAIAQLADIQRRCKAFVAAHSQRQKYLPYFLQGFSEAEMHPIAEEVEQMVEHLANSRNKMVVAKLMDVPVLRTLWVYHPAPNRIIGIAMAVLFPIGLPLWWIGTNEQQALVNEYKGIAKVCGEIEALIVNDKKENKNNDI